MTMSADSLRVTFPQLSENDAASLMQLATPRSYERGAIIIERGSRDRSLMIVRAGIARVESAEAETGIALARLGSGQVLGEISFVESGGASADVRAEEAVTVDVITEDDLLALLSSDPGFASRFYRSLAVVLAVRLRDASNRLAALSPYETLQSPPFHTPQTGQVSDRQLPDTLRAGLRDFNATIERLATHEYPEPFDPEGIDAAIVAEVAGACDGIVGLLQTYTEKDKLLEISYDDLLAFRDAAQISRGIGSTIFRETYAAFMASTTMARCYMKPRGFAEDHETLAAIYRNEPEGDGPVGALIDRWFLSRPLCRSRRGIRDLMTERLKEAAAGDGKAIQTRTNIIALASGTASEVIALLNEAPRPEVMITAIDCDDEALLASAAAADRLGYAERFGLVHADVLRLAKEPDRYAFAPQDVIYAGGLCEYLDDGQIIELLDWAHGQLKSGGMVALSTLTPENPDRVFMDHMLDWRLSHRTDEDMRALFARSRFSGSELGITADETGAGLLAECRKP
jgi:extracellular factor (EF) 3-hydroxypalmitic acid methyl ester biosynthesis protein